MKKGQISGTIFIPIILAVIILAVIFSFISAQRITTTVTDDQFTASNTSCVELTSDCIRSITSIENATGSEIIGSGNYSICGTLGVHAKYNGVLLSGDATVDRYNGQTVNATYVGISCSYITGMTGAIIDYIPILLAVLLIIAVAVYIK